MENEKKSCGCKRRWLIPVIAVAAVAVVAAVAAVFLLTNRQPAAQDGVYWNVDRLQYALDDRKAERDGTYRMRFAQNGEIKELSVVSKALADAIDRRNILYLDINEAGQVVGFTDPTELTAVDSALYIKRTDGSTVYANSSMALNGADVTLQLTESTQIYDVMPGTKSLGTRLQAGDLRFTDAFVAYTDPAGQVTHVFVTARSGSANVYWRTQRVWDNTMKMTGREPDAEGVYSIDFCCNGQTVTLKCREKRLVTTIDQTADSEAAFCFTIDEDGFITQVRDIRVGAHGLRICDGYVVRSVDGNSFTAVSPESATVTFTATLPETCGIYDVSPAAFRDGREGEVTDHLQVGDRVFVWTDADRVPMTVCVQRRQIDVPVFRIYPTTYYEASIKQTTRTPNADGWYLIELIKAGEPGVQVYRTQDKELVNFLDSQTTTKLVGLRLDGDVITQVYSSSSVYGGSVYYKGYVVDQVVGCMMNVQRAGRTGPAISMIMTEDCKIYDIAGIAPLGSETQLRPGDVVESQSNMFGQIEAVFITRRN